MTLLPRGGTCLVYGGIVISGNSSCVLTVLVHVFVPCTEPSPFYCRRGSISQRVGTAVIHIVVDILILILISFVVRRRGTAHTRVEHSGY